MSYGALSVHRSEALKLIHQQIEKGETLFKKSASTTEGTPEDALPPQSRDILALAFRQWADRTCSLLYKIFESSTYASGFEEIDSGGDTADPSRTTDMEYSLKRQLEQKLDHLKSLLDSIDDLEEYEKGPPETDNVCLSCNAHGPSGNIGGKVSAETIQLTANPKKVFVVQGENTRLNDDLFSFLRALHLEPIEWSPVIYGTGVSPRRETLISSAFSQAQAVVIFMTPDELVISKRFHRDDGEADNRTYLGQPSAEVLFGAGLALGCDPQRTVIVQIGQLASLNNIHEASVLLLNNLVVQRQEAAGRLRTAGCDIDTDGPDWLSVGDFRILPEEEINIRGFNEETKHGPPSNTAMDIPDLSGEARQLLVEAARDQSCTLSIISGISGLGIITNGRIFGIGSNKISWDAWDAAIRDLLEYGLIQDVGHEKESFLVTPKGYRLADLLSGKRGIN